jgi:hypothetical protein
MTACEEQLERLEERLGRLVDAIRGQAEVFVRNGALWRSGDSTPYCPQCWAETEERAPLRLADGAYTCKRCNGTWAASESHGSHCGLAPAG